MREIWLQKQVINKNCTINEPKMVYFQDALIYLDNTFLVMTWIWCMSGEQWILGFIWPTKIVVSQYQPRAMTFVLAWYNLISLISHCLLTTHKIWHPPWQLWPALTPKQAGLVWTFFKIGIHISFETSDDFSQHTFNFCVNKSIRKSFLRQILDICGGYF